MPTAPASPAVPISARDDVVLVPIAGLPPLPRGLVWCASHDNPRVRALDQAVIRLPALTLVPGRPEPSALPRPLPVPWTGNEETRREGR